MDDGVDYDSGECDCDVEIKLMEFGERLWKNKFFVFKFKNSQKNKLENLYSRISTF